MTVPELVTICVVGVMVTDDPPPPPQPIPAADTAIASPTKAKSRTPAFLRFLYPAKGTRNSGSRMMELAAPGRVSVNTAVTTYVPAGVDAVVFTVSAPVLAE